MNNKPGFPQSQIENRVFMIRGEPVMVDFHLSELYDVETKRINERVKRNRKRFPDNFMFQLSEVEWQSLQSRIATADKKEGLQSQIATAKRRTLPYVFTEQGVAMLSAVLNSDTAIVVSIRIMDAFVKMRKVLAGHEGLLQRMNQFELKQADHDQKFEQLFNAIEAKADIPNQGVFFNGQVFDAYEFASRIIRTAKLNIILIDNYIDETTLTQLAKKQKGVKVLLLTKNNSRQLSLDVKKANGQYGNFEVNYFSQSHDRFLIIDSKEVYHLGASLKDLGKKWFAFSRMDRNSVECVLNQIKEWM